MISGWDQARETLTRRLADQHEGALKAALDRALGAGCWTPETVKSRCLMHVGPGITLLHLDGRPLVRLTRPVALPHHYDDAELDSRVISVPGYSVEHFDWKPAP